MTACPQVARVPSRAARGVEGRSEGERVDQAVHRGLLDVDERIPRHVVRPGPACVAGSHVLRRHVEVNRDRRRVGIASHLHQLLEAGARRVMIRHPGAQEGEALDADEEMTEARPRHAPHVTCRRDWSQALRQRHFSLVASPRQRGGASSGAPHAIDAHSCDAPRITAVRVLLAGGRTIVPPRPFIVNRSRPSSRFERSRTTALVTPPALPVASAYTHFVRLALTVQRAPAGSVTSRPPGPVDRVDDQTDAVRDRVDTQPRLRNHGFALGAQRERRRAQAQRRLGDRDAARCTPAR